MTQAQNNYPPKLNFLPNTPVQVYFTYGDYKMIPSKNKDWSESYKYNVEVNDEKHTLFATPGLHRELQIRSIGPQCYVLITKAVELDDNNKEITRWSVLNVDGTERPAVEFTPEAPAAPSAPQTASAAPQPQRAVMAAPGSREDARLVWRSCVTLMGVCIEQAQKIYTDAGYEIEKRVEAHDIHATATTLLYTRRPRRCSSRCPEPPTQRCCSSRRPQRRHQRHLHNPNRSKKRHRRRNRRRSKAAVAVAPLPTTTIYRLLRRFSHESVPNVQRGEATTGILCPLGDGRWTSQQMQRVCQETYSEASHSPQRQAPRHGQSQISPPACSRQNTNKTYRSAKKARTH